MQNLRASGRAACPHAAAARWDTAPYRVLQLAQYDITNATREIVRRIGLEQMPSSCLLCDAAYGIMFVFFRMNNRREFVLKETRCRMIKAEEIEMLIDASDRLVSAVSTDFRRYLGI